MNKLRIIINTILILLFSISSNIVGQTISVPYRINQWDAKLGNHRVLVQVDKPTDAVLAKITWRRRDFEPWKKNIIITDSAGNKIQNRVVYTCNNEIGEIAFEPKSGKGIYAIYYLPTVPLSVLQAQNKDFKNMSPFPITRYEAYKNTASLNWKNKYFDSENKIIENVINELSIAKVIAFEALEVAGADELKNFNSFYPMEVIALKEEVEELEKKHVKQGFILFPESRRYPIRMNNCLPYRWITEKNTSLLNDTVYANEYFTFQIGVYALEKLQNLQVQFSDLKKGNKILAKENEFTCFNLEGTDWTGKDFKKRVDVQNNKVQALWCGLKIKHNPEPGVYTSQIKVQSGKKTQKITLRLLVNNKTISNSGYNELWRHSRLNWLNSKIGISDEPVPPYTPIQIKNENCYSILGRDITLSNSGFPKSAISYISMDSIYNQGNEILSFPVKFEIKTQKGIEKIYFDSLEMVSKASGVIRFQSIGKNTDFVLKIETTLESDGYIRYKVNVKSTRNIKVNDVRLQIPLRKEIAKYAMGKFGVSGFMPKDTIVPINKGMMYNVVWGGTYNAGIACWLKNEKDEWNADNKTKDDFPILSNWENGGKGFYELKSGIKQTSFIIHNGARTFSRDKNISFDFALMVTPFKPLTNFRWNKRIYHERYGQTPIENKVKEANIINVHHANILNPYINYPFVGIDSLKGFIKTAHKNNKLVKIYYTIRELSNRATEIWALRSLNDEIFIDDKGYLPTQNEPITAQKSRFVRTGYPWLAEHLVTNYRSRWHSRMSSTDNSELTNLVGVETDASIAVQGLSRWDNYYLEGMKWLEENQGVDGLYLDGIGYDRQIMKRLRKTMFASNPQSTIDFHGAVHNAWISLAPYLESIWYGEGANYHLGPDYWLIEISGIPFGLSGEILKQNSDANQFRGMVYGISKRAGWGNNYTAIGLWKLWDNFGMEQATPIGYWQEGCPVKTGNSNIKASVYLKNNRVLIAIGSWSDKNEKICLKIDLKELKLELQNCKVFLPEIKDMQQLEEKVDLNNLVIPANQGKIIVIENIK